MSTWLLEPRDTLVVRDGRPIQDSGLMRSVDFPWPSTIAGALRTRAGTNENGHFQWQPAQAKAMEVVGPLLVELDETGEVREWLAPAPRDCVFFAQEDGRLLRLRLQPQSLRDGELTDHGSKPFAAFDSQETQSKAAVGPQFWRWSELEAWLRAPAASQPVTEAFGVKRIERERRTHVAVERDTQTAADGKLFSTVGLRFTTVVGARLALAARTTGAFKGGVIALGGERRPTSLRAVQTSPFPSQIMDILPGPDRLLRLVLLTPACFQNGAVPDAATLGSEVELVTWCVPRPEIVSGWDFETNKPKATRRLAPAGSVYWLRLKDEVDDNQFRGWLERTSMHCISDNPQDRLDGFGLAIVGVG